MSQIIQHHTHYYDATDNVYYNAEVRVEPNSTEPVAARYSETRNEPLLNGRGDDYLFTIERFSVPVSEIPIFFFKLEPGGAPTEGIYSVTLSFGGTDQETKLLYVPRFFNFPQFAERPVYQYQHFVDMINTALATAYTLLDAAVGPFPSATAAPYMTYDSSSGLFTIHVQKAFEADGIDLWFNWDLYQFFQSFEIEFYGYNDQASGKDTKILIKDNNNNTDPLDPTMYLFTQEQRTLYLWYDITKIIFTSNTIPVQKEYVGGLNENGDNIFLPIITDFIPEIGVNFNEQLSNLVYFPTGPYRLVDINSSSDIRKIDFQAFWQDKNRVLRPIVVQPGQSLEIKMLFLRKTTTNLRNAR